MPFVDPDSVAPIDLNRPKLQNADGSFSTERTITIEADGKHYLIPTIVNGKQLPEQQAISEWASGRNNHVGVFGSASEADAAARSRSSQIGVVRGFVDPDAVSVRPKAIQASPAPDVIDTAKNVVTNAMLGPAEVGTAIGSGALATPIAGVAGLLQGAKNLVSPGMSAADRVRQFQGAMTYQPRTEFGKTVMDVAAVPGELMNKAGEKVADLSGSPGLGAAVTTGLNAIPMALGPVAAGARVGTTAVTRGATEAAAQASRSSVKSGTMQAAFDEGFVLPSTESSGPSFLRNRLEGMAGKAGLAQEANLRNQQIASQIGRREAGLAEDAPLTEGTLAQAREVIAAPYREVAAVSTRAETALEKMKEARQDAKDLWRSYNQSPHPDTRKAATAKDNQALMYEKLIEHEATRIGRTGLLDELRDARVKLAKNYDVEQALNLGSGEIDMAVWGRMLDRRGEKSLSGGILTAAKFAQAFRRYAQQNSLLPTPGHGEGAAAVALGLTGHGWLPAGLPLLKGPARSIALSESMQPGPTIPGASYHLSDFIDPRFLGLIPVTQPENK